MIIMPFLKNQSFFFEHVYTYPKNRIRINLVNDKRNFFNYSSEI